MQPGVRPKPTVLKVLNGNPGKRPLNENEPQFSKKIPDCPKYIQDDGIAYAEWNRWD